MATTEEERVRERAYHLWREEGGHGDALDYWLRAEREMSAADVPAEQAPKGKGKAAGSKKSKVTDETETAKPRVRAKTDETKTTQIEAPPKASKKAAAKATASKKSGAKASP